MSDTVTLTLTATELELVLEGLDDSAYWRYRDELPHSNGTVFVPGDPAWEERGYDDELDDDEQEAVDAVLELRALIENLQAQAKEGGR